MFKKVAILSLVGVALFSASSAYAYIKNYSSYISLDNHTSTKYSVPFKATTTASKTSYLVNVSSNVYFNSAYKTSDDASGSLTAKVNTSTTGKSGTNGEWEIESFHYQWLSEDDLEDAQNSTDSVYYDKTDWALLKSSSDKEAKAFTQKVDNAINEFKAQTVKSITNDLNLDLTDYKIITVRDAIELDKTFTLLNEVKKVLDNQEEGDIKPTIYLHESKEKGYILQKKANGISNAFELVNENGKWYTTDEKSKKGKKLLLPEID
ncbi:MULTISPECIES: hypothetical protein [Brevibacillus]|jgi:hypothetical protein|uniref:hypothetical protein n=1 Tax=Brevibacillus TaxID=55080 RepID=UPI000EE5DD94|nr:MULTISPECIES: hypothetical protein [Brevibacillus]MDR4998390.1 hypothetical protein [Brevibacillus parabrevis]HBZ81416.1 hypothetical protein [Brevibacillus sp.]